MIPFVLCNKLCCSSIIFVIFYINFTCSSASFSMYGDITSNFTWGLCIICLYFLLPPFLYMKLLMFNVFYFYHWKCILLLISLIC